MQRFVLAILLTLGYSAFAQSADTSLDVGDTITLTGDLNFGADSRKTFCDGQEVSNYFPRVRCAFAKNVCQIFATRGKKTTGNLILFRGQNFTVRKVEPGWIGLVGSSVIILECANNNLKRDFLAHAFGDIIAFPAR